MSLTDDWKAAALAPMLYYVKYKDGRVGRALLIETPDYYGFYNNCDLNDEVEEVLAPVPSYEELQQLEKEVAKGDRIIGELLNEGSAATKKNKRLISLLKECKQHMYFQKEINSETIALLTRINTTLSESEKR